MQFIARMIVSSRKLNLSLGRDTDATMLASCWSVTVFRAGAQHRQLVRRYCHLHPVQRLDRARV